MSNDCFSSEKKRNRRKKGGGGGDNMLDSVLDESEIQAGCNISLQVSNIKSLSTSRMNFALFGQILTLPLFLLGKAYVFQWGSTV